jgi:KipI family sensor histidine kinase inhibitor
VTPAEIVPLGENALIVRLSDALDADVNNRARQIADDVERADIAGITDVVPANSSVGIYFTSASSLDENLAAIRDIVSSARAPITSAIGSLIEIPVVYDGPDLADIASKCELHVDDVIALHAGRDYQVFAVGFAPGFGYLGEVDERIAVPRRGEPRTKVPAGSVAIANRQTAVYPLVTPGGWNLIGSTSLPIFDKTRSPAALLQVGDRVRFVPV